MQRRTFGVWLGAVVLLAGSWKGFTQTGSAYRVDVDLVAVRFEVEDNKGNAVRGLTAADIRLLEDGIPQQIANFAGVPDIPQASAGEGRSGASIYLLFNTSNGMYNTFPYVYDAISEFIRRLDKADSIAIYTFSRNLFRAAPLTKDHAAARAGLANAVVGDDTALFNSLLLTIRDAAKVPGGKAIVVFSNGHDNASMVSPGDVARVAENEGIPIYVISTDLQGKQGNLSEELQSLVSRTGGKLYGAGNWSQQANAFRSAREDIENSYTAYYYPAPNPNEGFRKLTVEIQSAQGKSYRVRARSGYDMRARKRISATLPLTPKSSTRAPQ